MGEYETILNHYTTEKNKAQTNKIKNTKKQNISEMRFEATTWRTVKTQALN